MTEPVQSAAVAVGVSVFVHNFPTRDDGQDAFDDGVDVSGGTFAASNIDADLGGRGIANACRDVRETLIDENLDELADCAAERGVVHGVQCFVDAGAVGVGGVGADGDIVARGTEEKPAGHFGLAVVDDAAVGGFERRPDFGFAIDILHGECSSFGRWMV